VSHSILTNKTSFIGTFQDNMLRNSRASPPCTKFLKIK